MKNSKQKTLRHGSAVFTDKHCLYRIAVVRYVDSLFYEPGDACRCHSRCFMQDVTHIPIISIKMILRELMR